MNTAKPCLGPMIETWYKTRQGDVFEVVNFDEPDGSIEIQCQDGSVEELDEDAWASLQPKVVDPPREGLGDGDEDDETGGGFDAGGDEDEDHDNRDHDWRGGLDEY